MNTSNSVKQRYYIILLCIHYVCSRRDSGGVAKMHLGRSWKFSSAGCGQYLDGVMQLWRSFKWLLALNNVSLRWLEHVFAVYAYGNTLNFSRLPMVPESCVATESVSRSEVEIWLKLRFSFLIPVLAKTESEFWKN